MESAAGRTIRQRARQWRGALAAADAHQEGPGLVRLSLPTPTLPPATTTNHWLVGWHPMVVVDPATPDKRAQARLGDLVNAARAAGAQPQALLLTHHHLDHSGAAADLGLALGLPVICHAQTAPLLAAEIAVARLVAEGEVIARNADGAPWIALHTPGHAPGHLVLHQPQSGWVVAGDLVAGTGTILVDPRDGDMGQYLASLARVEALQPAALAPAHGPVLTDAVAVLRHYQAHRREREQKILSGLSLSPHQAADLLPIAYADVPRLVWPLALRAMEAHLLHLQQQGLARATPSGWVGLSVANPSATKEL